MIRYVQKNKRSSRVGKVDFGVFSGNEIEKMAVVEVRESNIYQRGIPNAHGINDHRMGTVDRRILCGTCGETVKNCQGHTGFINLPLPCYHILYIEETLKILRSVCFFCGKLSVTQEEAKSLMEENTGKQLFAATYFCAKNKKRCPYCNGNKALYSRCNSSIKIEWPEDCQWECTEEMEFATKPFNSTDALSILNAISDSDVEILGMNVDRTHPRNLMLTKVMVPPPISRPAIMASEGSRARGQDDITHKLQDINKRSIDLREAIASSANADVIVEKWSKLQMDCASLITSNIKGLRQLRPIKTIVDRLKGKDGRIRGNLMGKRVDFSARSVITPDATIDVDQVGIPYSVAQNLTIPERITPGNINELQQRVLVGANNINGAEKIICNDDAVIDLASCQKRDSIRLQYGWIVERYLKNNDYVIFNRQPSLHKMGMMGHRVVLVTGSTFRLNLSVANPYNADFDGDEMNCHVPQSLGATSEVMRLMSVPTQIISPQSNKPCMGIVQDSLLGAYLMTKPGVFLNKKQIMILFSHTKYTEWKSLPAPAIKSPVQLWTGTQLFSMLFPSTLSFYKCKIPLKVDIPGEEEVYIRNGTLLVGIMRKQVLGTSINGIIDVMYRDFGMNTTVHFMSDVQRMVNNWLLEQGFSVGIQDCVLTEDVQKKISERVLYAFQNTESILKENVPDNMKHDVEGTITKILSKLLMQVGETVKENVKDNAIATMVDAGSKGNPVNLSQICGCVGQQSVEGKRIVPEYLARTLSCFDTNEKSINVNGFVHNSYALGLEPHEYFFHAMGGREGLVDTAVKTATTGYIQRRQVKAMEDNRASYDGVIRNAQNAIIQFIYGNDGNDATKLEKQLLPSITMKRECLRQEICCETPTVIQTTEFDKIWDLNKKIRDNHVNGVIKTLDNAVLLPFNIVRYLSRADASTGKPMSEAEIFEMVETLVQQISERQGSSLCAEASIRFCLRSKKLLSLRMSREDLEKICTYVKCKHLTAIITGGEMVGSIAAQSLGEPCTQLTLNSFHLSGVANMGLTMGIPRLKEILDFSKNMKTPYTKLIIAKPYCFNQSFVEKLKDTLPCLLLGTIVRRLEILTSTNDLSEEVKFMLDMHARFYEMADFSENFSVMFLNKDEMRKYELTPVDLSQIVMKNMSKKVHVVASEVNSVSWWICCYFSDVCNMVDATLINTSNSEKNAVHRVSLMMLDQLEVTGHSEISSTSIEEIDVYNREEMVNEKQYSVNARGFVLPTISNIPSVIWEKCSSNDINSIYEYLGIEAATVVLFQEIQRTVSFDGTYVDPRHISLLADTMTYRGYIMPISRHGINRANTGPLARCSFEETADVLADAAFFGETDDSKGISQNIMSGQSTSIGTGAFDLLIPEEHILMAKVAKRPNSLVKSVVRVRSVTETVINGVEYSVVVEGKNSERDCENDFPYSVECLGREYEHYEGNCAAFVPSSPTSMKS